MTRSRLPATAALLSLAVFLPLDSEANTENEKRDLSFSAGYGISPFGNGLTLELQKNHHVFGVSLTNVAYKYEFEPADHGWFVGAYHTHKAIVSDDDESYDLVDFFNDVAEESTLYRYRRFGLGGGYSWKWKSGFRFSLSTAVGLGNYEGNLDEAPYSRFSAGFNFGYQF